MKKTSKIILIILILAFIISCTSYINAASNYTITPEPVQATESMDFRDMVGRITGLVKWASVIGAIIMLTVLGVKYMMGSLSEKAQYKKSMVPWVVGIILVVVSSTIVDVIYDILII